MISELLQNARNYESQMLDRISDEERPKFHLTGGSGWINDPNGFSFFKGAYHLFYQYHPYSNNWGSMYWGHAVSEDLLTWKRLPVAMAPDEKYDNFGCFSGSAIVSEDGRHMILYTGVETLQKKRYEQDQIRQTQCLAFGDGVNYEKYAGNPVIVPEDVPGGCAESDFRDPKMWRDEDGTFYAVVSAMNRDFTCRIVLFQSHNGFDWEYAGTLAESTPALGGMWECPDFFELDGKHVLLVSPMAMMPDDREFHVGHNTMAIIGEFDKKSGSFMQESLQAIDSGIDFYAPQTTVTPDGRRVMIGWMQAWSNSKFVPPNVNYFGQLTLPRELSIREGRLIQNPIRELEDRRKERVIYNDLRMDTGKTVLPGVRGRLVDMTITVKDLSKLKKLTIRVAADGNYYTDTILIPEKNLIRLERDHSGYLYDIVHSREMQVKDREGMYKIRFILDRYSMEVFVNDGERAGTLTFFTPQEADGIEFWCEGQTAIDVEKYELG